MEEQNIRCPKCGSTNVDRHWGDKLLSGGASLIGGMIEGYFGGSGETGGTIASGIADEIFQNFICKKCGHKFTKEDVSTKSSNSISSSNNKSSNSGNFYQDKPFKSNYQNALYKELRKLSSDKGGFSKCDYETIGYLGNSYGLSREEIYEVAMKCMWKKGVNPSFHELFFDINSPQYNKETSISQVNNTNIATSKDKKPSKNYKKYSRDMYGTVSYRGFDYKFMVERGIEEGLSMDEIYSVLTSLAKNKQEKIPSKKDLFRGYTFEQQEKRKATAQHTQSSGSSNSENTKLNDKKVKTGLSNEELEYFEELKSIYSEQTEISERERRLLNRLYKSLGLSEERAKELEDQLNPNNLSENEIEYAEELKACLEDDGEISHRERHILNRLANSLNISPARAEEIEQIIKK